MSSSIYHLSLGSNLGDRLAQLNLAKSLISEQLGKIQKESSIYETEPWGVENQPWFLNQVVSISTDAKPMEVLHTIKQIEVDAGRIAGEKWHARHMDIDILLHGNVVINEDSLIIPHPHFHERNFALIPLMEIAGQVIHPIFQSTIEELYQDSKDTGEVYIFNTDEQEDSL